MGHGLATRKTLHTEEAACRAERAWAGKHFDALGTVRENSEHELWLIFQAEVRSSGAQGSWETVLGRKELMWDNRHLLLSQCWPITRPHYFLQSFNLSSRPWILFFLSPCLKIHLPPYYVLDEDETPSSYMWAGASLLSGWPFHPVLAGSLCSKLMLNVVEVLCVPPLRSTWARILSQSSCSDTQNCWCLSGDLNDGRNQTEKSNGKSIIDRGTVNSKVIMSSE